MKSKSVRCLVKSLYCKDTAAMYTTYQSVKLSINLIKIQLSINPMKLYKKKKSKISIISPATSSTNQQIKSGHELKKPFWGLVQRSTGTITVFYHGTWHFYLLSRYIVNNICDLSLAKLIAAA